MQEQSSAVNVDFLSYQSGFSNLFFCGVSGEHVDAHRCQVFKHAG